MGQKITPFNVSNLVMNGSFQEFVIPPEGNTVLIQARNAVNIQISNFASGTDYWTLKSGTAIEFNSYNTNSQSLYLNGDTGKVVEIFISNKA